MVVFFTPLRTPKPEEPYNPAHEEGEYVETAERRFSVNTVSFSGADGAVTTIHGNEVSVVEGRRVPMRGTDFEIDADLVLIALGFSGAEQGGLHAELGVDFDDRGRIIRDSSYRSTVPGVYVAGDNGRGQSLIVWAIAEGRAAAAAVDADLMGETALPVAVAPEDKPLSV